MTFIQDDLWGTPTGQRVVVGHEEGTEGPSRCARATTRVPLVTRKARLFGEPETITMPAGAHVWVSWWPKPGRAAIYFDTPKGALHIYALDVAIADLAPLVVSDARPRAGEAV